jgi:hypothetical protein
MLSKLTLSTSVRKGCIQSEFKGKWGIYRDSFDEASMKLAYFLMLKV